MLIRFRQSKLIIGYYFIVSLLVFLVPYLYLSRFNLVGNFKPGIEIWALVLFFYFFHKLHRWFETIYTISDEGVVISIQEGIVRRLIQDVEYSKIGSIAVVKSGLGAMLFGYGDIEISTIGSNTPIRLKRVSKPVTMMQLIKKKADAEK